MKKFLISFAMISLMLGAGSASAQDDYGQYSQQPGQSAPPPPPSAGQPDSSQQSDQGAPGVGRLSFMQGDVSSQRGDNGDWVAATANSPISVGDRVATGQNSRAEIELDSGNILRMSDSATAKIAAIDRSNIQVQVGQGLVTYSVLRASEANSEIDTPNAAIHPDGPGDYRIQVNSDGETSVTVRQGSADISEPQGSAHVDAGQMITIQGTDNPQYKISGAPAQDAWDSWNSDRDRRIGSASSWRDTDRYYTGSEDLDGYGTWSEVPDYGPVWIPQEGPGWVPYSSGRWVWEPYYGWTWVSYEPWGWAPYHYGRWFVYGGNWVWWPGPVYGYPGYYPIWAPAYVSFFGWGGGWGLSFGFGFGFGHIGWLPCGPGDWYHPWWGRWGGRYATYNITNINNFHDGFRPIGPGGARSFSNVGEAFRNDRVRAGFVSMDSSRFGRDAVTGRGPAMSEASLRQASMVGGRMPISPSRESFSPSGRAASGAAFRSAPPASQHFFSAASRGNANGFGSRSLSNAGNTARESSAFANRSSGAITSSRPGWHAFTPPQNGAARGEQSFQGSRGGFENANPGAQSADRGGWQHYTPPSGQSQSGEFNRGFSQPNNQQRSFSSPGAASRRGFSNSYSNSYSRPQLNMRQPIVTPRGGSYGNGSYGRSPYGSSAPRGGYTAPRSNYSAPRGNYSAPRGNYSAPRSSGGSHGGGGKSSGGRR